MGLGGMEMMLKSMGINPEEIKASIESFKSLATEVAARQKQVEEGLGKILANQAQILTKLDEILSEGQSVLSKDSMTEHFAEAGEPIEKQKGWAAPISEDAYGDAAGSSGN